MKIKMIPLLAIVVSSLVLSGCLKQVGQVQETGQQNEGQEQVANEDSFSGSLKELLGLGKKVKCSWQFRDPEGNGVSEGVVWVDGNRSRSEISIETGEDDMAMDLIQISDGKMSYMWNRGEKNGSKFDIAEMEKLNQEMQQENGETQNQAETNWEKMYDYKCRAWRVDESKFTVPSDVEFTDMMAQMNQAQEQLKTTKENMAGVCDSLPEPAKSQCQESL